MRSRSGGGIGPNLIGGGDEEDLRKIERQIEIVIAESIVLLRIENLQQRRRRIAAVVVAELVNLVEHHDGIVNTGAADRLNYAARHRADVGATMSAQFGFVAHATERHALKLPSQRARDRTTQRSLANSRRSDKTENRTLGVRSQLDHGQKLEDAFLHVFEAIVVFIENLARFVQIEFVFRRFPPGQFQDVVEIGADDVVVRRRRRQFFQTL